MPWWGWVLVALVLLAAAGIFFFLIGRSLWRRGAALFQEIGEASDRLSVVSDQLQELSRRNSQTREPAVFESPSQLRQARAMSRPRTRGSESGRQRLR
jgi:predicted PurR-regulated permease PerM